MSNNVLWAGYRTDCYVGVVSGKIIGFEVLTENKYGCYFGKLKPNTTYTIKRLDTSSRMRIGVSNTDYSTTYTTVYPADYTHTQIIDSNDSHTFTTNASTQYIVVYYTNTSETNIRVMLNEGTSILPYEAPTEPIPYSWIITDGINNNYPYMAEVPLPSDTTLTEPYPTWIWRIDQFYNDGYPYLIGLRPPYVIPDDKYVDGHGLAVVWGHLLNLLEEKADLAYVDNAVAETVLVNSTTETATNQKWLDGKPIYRKVFEVDDAELDSESITQISLNIDSPETMTNLFATLEFGSSTQPSIINIGSFWANGFDPTNSVAIRIICHNGNLMIYKQGTNSTSYKNLRITVEFTKTTD